MGLSYNDAKRLGIGHLHPVEAGSPRSPRLPGVYRITIPGWHPARLNELLEGKWVAARLKKRDRKIVRDYAGWTIIPIALRPRRVHLAITLGKGQRAGDPDCYWKSLLDALVHCGLLIDDNRQHVVLDPVEFVRGVEPETTIELYDL
jgi:hypothetical protein